MLFKTIKVVILACILLFTGLSAYANKQVALTIDDLPFVGTAGKHQGKLRRERERFTMALETLRQYKVPATGFVVTHYIEKDQWQLLEQFQQDGHVIANHTDTHLSLNRSSTDRFIDNIQTADNVLQPFFTDQTKYFRYPFLATGRGCKKKLAVRDYLHNQHYTIVPVTIDAKDYKFNSSYYRIPYRQRSKRLNSLKRRYLAFIQRQINKAERKADKKMGRPIKHIFLIHMNTLNALVLGDIIELFHQNGYEFITLAQALQDPYYQSNPFAECEPHLAKQKQHEKQPVEKDAAYIN